jgi:hypothetical protein
MSQNYPVYGLPEFVPWRPCISMLTRCMWLYHAAWQIAKTEKSRIGCSVVLDACTPRSDPQRNVSARLADFRGPSLARRLCKEKPKDAQAISLSKVISSRERE